ncbi:MAG: hypothetical protein HQ507_01855 [Candidatus Marinimicrobia bacterium]|nr:hypothetical protein [Candidatus Neomarinimicrobiota bacterium]
MHKLSMNLIIAMGMLYFLVGCATFRTEMEGSSGLEQQKTMGTEPVDVLFVSKHLQQTRGLDAIQSFRTGVR